MRRRASFRAKRGISPAANSRGSLSHLDRIAYEVRHSERSEESPPRPKRERHARPDRITPVSNVRGQLTHKLRLPENATWSFTKRIAKFAR